ncbi:hypothetical protein [Sphingomonas sp.]|uniref:hypothetical protein n=1 Tax=Sphingomonas sp. TaxID=28214 RepID=UPI001795FA7A|nr:hypothetical protein [Sphingomonas sp.]MBA3510784.1 hypothetical protein [Sphingomonas sp.]
MTRTPLILCLAAAAALAGCDQEAVTVNTGLEDNVTTNDVVLPPSISASKIYRCKDNSIVYIDWLSDNKSANVRTERNGPPTHVVAPAEGEPMVAEGFSLTGTGAGSSVTLTRPGKGSQSCHV